METESACQPKSDAADGGLPQESIYTAQLRCLVVMRRFRISQFANFTGYSE